jgi:hypothetical protein
MKRKAWMRIIFLLGVLGAGGLIIRIALRPTPLRVEAAIVDCGPLRVTIDAEGKTRVRDRFVVAAPVTEMLLRMTLRRGGAVESDAVVYVSSRCRSLLLTRASTSRLTRAQWRRRPSRTRPPHRSGGCAPNVNRPDEKGPAPKSWSRAATSPARSLKRQVL